MEILGISKVTTVETPYQIEFTVVRERGLLEYAWPVLVICGFLVFLGITHFYLGLWVPIVFAVLNFSTLSKGNVTRLYASRYELIAQGNLGRPFTRQIRFNASEITFLGYYSGGRAGARGLYAGQGWFRTCLLPNLDREQASAVADAIKQKFAR